MRIFLYIFAVLVIITPQSVNAADPKLVKKVERYLQSLDRLQADFTQTSPDGYQLEGVFYLNRPGRLRFDYNAIDDFVVADGRFIYFYDSELKSQSHAPIGETLANFLLREDLALSGDVSVTQAFENEDEIVLTVTQTQDPEAGALTLFFNKNEDAIALRQWIVRDAQNNLTKVSLRNLDQNPDLEKNLFVYHDPEGDAPVYNE